MTLRFVEAFVFCSANFLTQPAGFRPRPHRSALAGRRWPPLAAPGRAPAPAGRPCPPRRPSYQEARHVHSMPQQQGAISLQIICPLSLASLHKVQVWFQGRSFPVTQATSSHWVCHIAWASWHGCGRPARYGGTGLRLQQGRPRGAGPVRCTMVVVTGKGGESKISVNNPLDEGPKGVSSFSSPLARGRCAKRLVALG